jgi:hypothetical protein
VAKGTESISRVVEEYSPSVSTPKYIERFVLPFRTELLNEYAHFIIAGCNNGEDLKVWLANNNQELRREFDKKLSDSDYNNALAKLQLFQDLSRSIKTVLNNENRWIKDRTLREMLASVAAQSKSPEDQQQTNQPDASEN